MFFSPKAGKKQDATAKALELLASPPGVVPSPRPTESPSAASLAALKADVWVRGGKTDPWVPGRVENEIGRSKLLVRTAKGTCEVDLATHGELFTVNPGLEPDMTSLWYLHEPGILHNLRGRFELDEPYTSVAHLLIAVNPLKPLASPEMPTIAAATSTSALGPHPYVIAEAAYRELLLPAASRRSQSIVVSGESGAGKTESTKILMRYLAWRAAAATAASAVAAGVEAPSSFGLNERILQSNPILESLGNGKTQRNHNSSRFGKYIRLHFAPPSEGVGRAVGVELLGAQIDTYLLEKSRLISQQQSERNFHVFYELLAGASAAQRTEWRLGSPLDYAYLRSSGCVAVPQHDDADGFSQLCAALRAMGLGPEPLAGLLRCLAALLHLGNISFASATGGGANVTIVDRAPLAAAAELLGLQLPLLEAALTTRTVTTPRGGQVESFTVQLEAAQADLTRDGLAKAAYAALFEWAVSYVNAQLGGTAADAASAGCDGSAGGRLFIGILDIFGFEAFERNSLEQLLINYANEKLQATFNTHVFAAEQELYAAEGISWRAVRWPDNSGALGLIAGKERGAPPGLLHLLDEACRLPRTTDVELNKKFHDAHGAPKPNAHFPPPEPRKRATQFKVAHYAGEVAYSIEGFLEKNNGSLSPDLAALCASSSHEMLARRFRDTPAAADASGKSLEGQSAERKVTDGQSAKPELSRRRLGSASLALQLPGPDGAAQPSALSPVRPSSPKANSPSVPKLQLGGDKGGDKTPRRASVFERASAFSSPRASETDVGGASPRGGGATPRGGHRSFESIGLQFARQMGSMVSELNETRCNFIRCIKPNASMTAGVFEPAYTAVQLRQTGMLQCCELLKHGYPTRVSYAEVYARYAPVLPAAVRTHPALADGRRFAGAILYAFEVDKSLYQLGTTRAFFRPGGVAQLDRIRTCDMAAAAPIVGARVTRFLVLQRFRLALAHTRASLTLTKLLRSVRALHRWQAALRVGRVYRATLLKLLRRVRAVRAATTLQSYARMAAPRAAFIAHARELYEARARTRRAAIERRAVAALQAAARGHRARVLQRRRLLQVLVPAASQLQAWWRVVLGERQLRKLRSVVERFTEGHRRLVAELCAMLQTADAPAEPAHCERTTTAAVGEVRATTNGGSGGWLSPSERRTSDAPDAAARGRRFPMWVTLRVGLPEDAPSPPAFGGSQIYSARTAALRRAGGALGTFFCDASNVDTRDDDGHYLVRRSWKHFDAILDFMRDGSCSLPGGYVPTTYDTRPPSSEDDELLEFVREVAYYGLPELLLQAMRKLLTLKYGANPQTLALLKARGLPVG